MDSVKDGQLSDELSKCLRPMALSRKVALFRREIVERLSPAAFEILIGAGEVVAEGSFEATESDQPFYLGSVQVRVALDACKSFIRDPLDAATARRLVQVIRDEPSVRAVLGELAQREAERAAGCALFDLQVEQEVSHKGAELHIALDVEGQVRPRGRKTPSHETH